MPDWRFWPLLLALGLAQPPATADPATLPIAAPGVDESARQLMLAIDDRYENLRDVPRQARMRMTATTRMLGERDRHVRGTALIRQQGSQVRFDMDVTVIEHGDGASSSESGAGHLTWTTDGAILRIRYQSAEAGAMPAEMLADFRRLPVEIGQRFRDPMGEPELGREFLNHPFTLRDAVLDGRPVKVLRSMSEISFSRISRANVTLWVDPDTLLIPRAVYDGVYVGQETSAPYWIQTEMDLSYELNAVLPEGIFSLPIGSQARDITEIVAREGRAALGLLP